MTTQHHAGQGSASPGPNPDLVATLRQLCESIAAEAAVLVAERRATLVIDDTAGDPDRPKDPNGASMGIATKSSPVDLVTDVDRAAEELIVALITAARPDDSIIGEEGTQIRGSSGVGWVIDPIDGTTSFVHGYPGYTVSVAAAVDDRVVAGAVADPTHSERGGIADLFSAGVGLGAHRNGHQLAVATQRDLSKSLVATGFGYEANRRRAQANVLAQILPNIADIRRSGSAALDLCRVGSGQVDAYFEVGLNPWDLGAGLLIAAEAGAITRADFPENRSSFTVAVAPGISEQLLALLDATGAHVD